jgi:hypothetical protein
VAQGPIIVCGKFGVLSFGLPFEVVGHKPEHINEEQKVGGGPLHRLSYEQVTKGQHNGKITGTIRAQPKLSWHNSPNPEFEVGIPAWKGTLCRRK